MLRVSGLDLSLTSTGAARLVVGVDYVKVRPVTATFDTPASLCKPGMKHPRLQWVTDNVRVWVKGSDLVVVEGPSYDSHQGQHKIGGLWWMTTHILWTWKIPYVVIAPSKLKTYALGKGSGKGTDKDRVLAAVIRRYSGVAVDGNDEADALVLAAMAADHYGHPVAEVPETHRRALEGVDWPDLEA